MVAVAGRRPAPPPEATVTLSSFWAKLDGRRRIVVAAATAGVFVALAVLARGPGPGEMSLLYAGLDPAAAGEVVAALEARGTPFDVRGDSIWVPAGARDLERMTLAAEGLPATSARGYELLDELSGFGTTSQMFDAAYWRAKEGELARTILAVPQIRSARVHISAGGQRAFGRAEAPSAAVTVTAVAGQLGADQARALRHLVAAAVPGLAPADVAVIDGQGGLVDEDEDEAPDSRAEALRARAERLLEARVGPGNAVVEVTVETVTESERLTERVVDPESRVVISTETEERESASQGAAGGGVTVASNLPDGDAAQGAAAGPSSQDSETRQVTNFEVSETSREVTRAPGAVRRLTVAVLVNDIAAADAEGVVTTTPRAEAELAALGELVASAVGLDPGRGDVLTIKSMPFEAPPLLGSEAAPAPALRLDAMVLIRWGLAALVALALVLFVLRPILRGAPGPAALPLPAPASRPAQPAVPSAALSAPGSPPALAAPAGLAPDGAEDPVARLRGLIASRQQETARILQSWIEDGERA
jgi:flagellar M-ring protein FliF